LYSSTDIIKVIKFIGMRRVWNVASTGEMRNAFQILVRQSQRKRPLEDLGVDGRV
jgi:hypothetical protein